MNVVDHFVGFEGGWRSTVWRCRPKWFHSWSGRGRDTWRFSSMFLLIIGVGRFIRPQPGAPDAGSTAWAQRLSPSTPAIATISKTNL